MANWNPLSEENVLISAVYTQRDRGISVTVVGFAQEGFIPQILTFISFSSSRSLQHFLLGCMGALHAISFFWEAEFAAHQAKNHFLS